MLLKGETIIHKLWYFLRTYVLTLRRFDLFLQGALLVTILLETNVFLLLTRDARDGYNPGLMEDFVMMGAGGAEFLLGALVAWFGRSRRQFSLAAWLGATAVVSLLVLVFPFAQPSPADVQLCGGEPVSALSSSLAPFDGIIDDNAPPRTAMLIITAVLCTLTKVCIWAHGLTYLDDHDPKNGPYFYGILISIRLSLGLSGRNWLQAGSVREDWWQAHLSISMLTLMFAVLFTLFPSKMPKQYDVEDDEMIDKDFCASLKRIMHNKALVTQIVALSFLSIAVFCFVHYDRAYVQARFHVEAIRQDPRTSRALTDIFRTLVIIFFVMIFRVRFSARRMDGVKARTAARVGGVAAGAVAVLFVALAAVGCDVGDVVGLGEGGYEPPACSQDCGCNSERYGFSPVCALDSRETYFSPCSAGCTSYEELNGFLLFHNCSCGGAGSVDAGAGRAVRGACSVAACRLAFSAYQLLYTLILAVAGAAFLMQGMSVLRAPRPRDRPLAVGVSFAAAALVASVLGHLIYLILSYATCSYPGDGGECLLHAPLLWSAGGASAAAAALSAAASLLATTMHAAEPTTEL